MVHTCVKTWDKMLWLTLDWLVSSCLRKYIYTYIYICMYMCVFMHVYVCINACVCFYTCMNMCRKTDPTLPWRWTACIQCSFRVCEHMHACMHICKSAYVQLCIHTYIQLLTGRRFEKRWRAFAAVCMNTCIHVCVCIYIYMHAREQAMPTPPHQSRHGD